MEGTPSGAVKNSKWVFEEEGGGRREESVVSVCACVSTLQYLVDGCIK